jgi:hypothetical protein
MAYTIVFVLASEEQGLPGDTPEWRELQSAQRQGIRSGVALRIFRVPSGWQGDLEDLVGGGRAHAEGTDPYLGSGGARSERICDAVVPHLEPRSLWLGVYELAGSPVPTPGEPPAPEDAPTESSAWHHPGLRMAITSSRCLDRFPLREAENETCWFYPTDNGTYLCWENQRRLETLPGFLPDHPMTVEPTAYARGNVHVLWSLMADDQALTCVGLTYAGRRIEWTTVAAVPEPFATWTSFEVDTMADASYREISSITVFPQPQQG